MQETKAIPTKLWLWQLLSIQSKVLLQLQLSRALIRSFSQRALVDWIANRMQSTHELCGACGAVLVVALQEVPE